MQSNLDKKIEKLKKKIEKLDKDIQEIYEYQIHPKYSQDKSTELKDRSCRDNIRIDDLK